MSETKNKVYTYVENEEGDGASLFVGEVTPDTNPVATATITGANALVKINATEYSGSIIASGAKATLVKIAKDAGVLHEDAVEYGADEPQEVVET